MGISQGSWQTKANRSRAEYVPKFERRSATRDHRCRSGSPPTRVHASPYSKRVPVFAERQTILAHFPDQAIVAIAELIHNYVTEVDSSGARLVQGEHADIQLTARVDIPPVLFELFSGVAPVLPGFA
jgi:hypothetical protein